MTLDVNKYARTKKIANLSIKRIKIGKKYKWEGDLNATNLSTF
jgi:hypothetical protein